MVDVKPILEKVLANTVRYFVDNNKNEEHTTINLDDSTTLLKFIKETIVIKLDIVQQLTYQHMALEVLISSNGRVLFMGELEGDTFILNRIADNIYYSLEGLMEVYLNDNQRNSSVKSALHYSR